METNKQLYCYLIYLIETYLSKALVDHSTETSVVHRHSLCTYNRHTSNSKQTKNMAPLDLFASLLSHLHQNRELQKRLVVWCKQGEKSTITLLLLLLPDIEIVTWIVYLWPHLLYMTLLAYIFYLIFMIAIFYVGRKTWTKRHMRVKIYSELISSFLGCENANDSCKGIF